MTHLERFLEALVTPFVDPLELRRRESFRASGLSMKRETGAKLQVAGLSLKAHGTTAQKGIRKRSAVIRS